MRKNFVLLWLRDAAVAASTALISTSMLSAFFIKCGMSGAQVSVYLAVIQVANFAVSSCCAGISARFRDTRRAGTVLYAAGGAATLLFAVFCFIRPQADTLFILLLALGCLVSAIGAVRFVFDYKLPCEVIDVSSYSTYVSFSNIAAGLAGMLAGMLLSYLYSSLDFFAVSAGAFLGSGATLFAAACFNKALTVIHPCTDGQTSANPWKSLVELLRNRDFRVMILPNLIRGIGAGTVSMIAVLAINHLGITDAEVSLITTFTYLGTLLSCLVYVFGAKKIGAPGIGLIGSALFCLLPLSFLSGLPCFLTVYLIAYIGYYVVCSSIPDIVYQTVPAGKIGAFHTWRMMLTTLGTAVSTAVIGALDGCVPAPLLLAIGSVSTLICSLAYYLYYRRRVLPTAKA